MKRALLEALLSRAPQYWAAKAELLKTADTIIARRYAAGVWLKEAWSDYA